MNFNLMLIFLIYLTTIQAEPQNKTSDNTTIERVKRSFGGDDSPEFWANRGKRSIHLSEELRNDHTLDTGKEVAKKTSDNDLFWGNRGRRVDGLSDESTYDNFFEDKFHPFWTSRGRRDEFLPFWTSRGRRLESDVDKLFWGSRGRRQDLKNQISGDDSQFWGSRGRRSKLGGDDKEKQDDLFWGNRGRREDVNTFWGSRGRRLNADSSSEESLLKDVQKSKLQSFWAGSQRNNIMKNIFDDESRVKTRSKMRDIFGSSKVPPAKDMIDSRVLRQDRLYVEEPYYIVVDRSSRSAEDDPYFISRGKKMSRDFAKAARERRGMIEEIAKSLHSDPYFVARGKKDMNEESFDKMLRSICFQTSSSDLTRVKRDLTDRDRERRTMLKKLAAELLTDPFYVSRGKKSSRAGIPDVNVEKDIDLLCHIYTNCLALPLCSL